MNNDALTTIPPTTIVEQQDNLPKGVLGVDAPSTNNHYIIADPMDLGAAAKITWRVIQQERAKADAAGKPFIFLTGEAHAKPSQVLFPIVMADKLTVNQKETGEKFVIGYEQGYHRTPSRERYDFNGTAANMSHKTVFNYMCKKEMPFYFMDAADTQSCFGGGSYFASRDPLLSIVSEGLYKNKGAYSGYGIKSREGVHIRNAIMVKRLLAMMRHEESSIGYLHCGRAHIFGDLMKDQPQEEEFAFNESLAVLFKNAGCHVLSAFNVKDKKELSNIPPQSIADNPETIIVEGFHDAAYANNYGRQMSFNADTYEGAYIGHEGGFIKQVKSEVAMLEYIR